MKRINMLFILIFLFGCEQDTDTSTKSLAPTKEIKIDLKDISNISTENAGLFTLKSKFNGYIISGGLLKRSEALKGRYVDDVILDGLDWKLFFGKGDFLEKPKTNIISSIEYSESIEFELSTEDCFSHQYSWEGLPKETLLNKRSTGFFAKENDGFSFSIKLPPKKSKYKIDLYSISWLSSSDFKVCLKDVCKSIKNDISAHMNSVKNSIIINKGLSNEVLKINLSRKYRQFDWDKNKGFHALEAIHITEVVK